MFWIQQERDIELKLKKKLYLEIDHELLFFQLPKKIRRKKEEINKENNLFIL